MQLTYFLRSSSACCCLIKAFACALSIMLRGEWWGKGGGRVRENVFLGFVDLMMMELVDDENG